MKTMILLLSIICAVFADAKLQVVASIPDLADMAHQIGAEAVNVITLASGREDLHAVPARPSFLPKLNRADLLLTLGLDAEHAWLPAIAAEARNPKIKENGPGWINCYEGIEILGIPHTLDRSEGEQHPQGNPHYNIGPQCGAVMAADIERAFASALPSKAPLFSRNAQAYREKLQTLKVDLKRQGKPLEGIVIIEYHPDLAYLSSFYGMKTLGSIEPKAGIPPTAGHLKELEALAKEAGVKLIVYNQSQNPKLPRKLAAAIGCQAVQIANAVGAQPEITTWIELQRYNLQRLLAGLSGGGR
jgi:zinc/manganese transport system substrate-binding protein